jgi:hypothetical protein
MAANSKDIYTLVRARDLAVGDRIKWTTRSPARVKPGTIHTLEVDADGFIRVGTTIGVRRLAPDDPVIRVVPDE